MRTMAGPSTSHQPGERQPRILITRAEPIPSERWEDYADRTADAGGEPVAGDLAGAEAGRPLPDHDGLLLTAGVDIDPARYGEPRSARVLEVNPRRDQFEFALLEAAYARGLPVLGICRGHQLFNVARGGSLLQHLHDREPHRARRGDDRQTVVSGWHDVALLPGTPLAEAVGAATVRVNSRHHQAVTAERVASGLVAAATAPDGVVEGLVDPSQRWAVSVQWHPEMPEVAGAFRGLFRSFVAACARAAERPAEERAARG